MKHSHFILIAAASVAVFSLGWWAATERPVSAARSTPILIDASLYPNLQMAFDILPEDGGVVRLPPGRYEITEPLVLSRSDTRIEGAGAASHIVNLNEEGLPAFIIRHPANPTGAGEGRRKQELWRVQLADFRISGNPKSGDGLLADAVNEIYIHGLAVDHNGGHGINLQYCYEDPRIADSILTYNGKVGINIDGSHDIVVNDNQFEENQDALRAADSFNLCMNGNNIDDHLRHGVVIENTYGSVLSGNMIEECQGTAIILDRDCYGIAIGSNVIAHNFAGVDLRDAWGSSVSANTFTIMATPALRIGPKSGRITVTGNSFSNSHVGDDTHRAEDYEATFPRTSFANGIVLESTRDIVVTGNLFSGLIEEAVRTQGVCRRIALVGNVSADLGRKAGQKLPAFQTAGAQEVIQGLNVFESGFETPAR
jgi:parallel beta-helix repeat protein